MELLKFTALVNISLAAQTGTEMFSSMKRIEAFLYQEEQEDDGPCVPQNKAYEKDIYIPHATQQGVIDTTIGHGADIVLSSVTSAWKTIENTNPKEMKKTVKDKTSGFNEKINDGFQLQDINMDIARGKLVGVIGTVGSGKSSLLMTMMSEMPIKSGRVSVNGSIAYSPQESWVFPGTILENVLFGEPFDKEQYKKTISVCALHRDLKNMKHGDKTVIGEKGYSLSGGQKARINLARAVYRNADIYFLDDPLSAVDSKVARYIFNKCICGALSGKTRILVTHRVQFLQNVDTIFAMKDGKVAATGNFQEIAAKFDISSLTEEAKDKSENAQKRAKRTGSAISSAHRGIKGVIIKDAGEGKKGGAAERIVEGTVGFQVYMKYFAAGYGSIMLPLCLLTALITQGCYNLSDWALTSGNISDKSYQYVYVSLIIGLVLVGGLRSVLFFLMTCWSSKNCHDTMFQKILRAPISFFDTNPVGRVVNRFSRDIGFMDDMIPNAFHIVLVNSVHFIGILVIVSISNPWTLLFIPPVAIIDVYIRQYSLTTTRAVKRIESASRSPVYTQLSTTLGGLQIIRAFKMEESFIDDYYVNQDKQTSAWFLFLATKRWFGLRLDCTVGIYFAGCILAAFIIPKSAIDGGLIGLSLSYVTSLLGTFQFLMLQTAELETYMTSVERVLEYTDLEQEAVPHTDVKPGPAWPQQGHIQFDDMSLSYSTEAPPILKHINLDIIAKEKIGIVGRTGAGKSSLISCLFRLTEPDGKIFIDNVEIGKLGLKDLRQKISIIPQDPVLFNGTLRYNLDPLEEFDDNAIWKALDQVKLKEKAEEMPGKLYSEMAESGSNFSVGQRQLVCLARAILRNNRILVIDEATANVDQDTDEQIQRTIRSKFKDCTVLCIAHRLNTIIDSDRVLVLDQGEVMQVDHPYNLLQDESGLFYQLVQQTDQHNASVLYAIAQTTYTKQQDKQHEKQQEKQHEKQHEKQQDKQPKPLVSQSSVPSEIQLETSDSENQMLLISTDGSASMENEKLSNETSPCSGESGFENEAFDAHEESTYL